MSQTTPPSERVIELVNRLSANGDLDKMLHAGLISPKVIGQREMYLQYDLNRRIKRMKIKEAKMCVAAIFNCDYRTVHRAVLSMEKD